MRSTIEAKHLEILDNLNSKDDEIDYLLGVVTILDEYTQSGKEIDDEQEGKMHMNGFLQMKSKEKKGQLYKDFINQVDGTSVQEPKVMNTYFCSECETSLLTLSAESCMICPKCGKSEIYFESGISSMSYDQEVNSEVNASFAYKRINHFNELLAQFQAKETTNIPQDIIKNIQNEIKKQRVSNKSELTQSKVKAYLKKLNYNKYYEHVAHITNILNGTQPPKMNIQLEETLRSMFRDIQEPFEIMKPKTRSNFLSYNYCLYKFCELLGEDRFLGHFSLLKSREKLYQQDKIWEKICDYMNWQYIATI
tara:strand:+ start:118 stop:1041 length:924 start_codon:yes stop_codon:yes gene_type:complete